MVIFSVINLLNCSSYGAFVQFHVSPTWYSKRRKTTVKSL